MSIPQIFRRLIPLLVSSILLSACNFPGVGAPPPDVITESTNLPPAEAPSEPTVNAAPTEMLTPQASPTPTPEPPPDWNVYTGEGYALSFYYPPGWDVRPRDDYTLDLYEIEGEGWAEIVVITAENADEAGLQYAAGIPATEIMKQLFTALTDDGTFTAPYTLLSRAGIESSVTHGHYDVFEESLFVGVVDLNGRSALLNGHDAGVEGTWEEKYLPIYENILVSLVATNK